MLRAGRTRFAELITAEMGKPVSEALAEVEKSAWVCEHYAEVAVAELADEQVVTERSSWIAYEPLGTVLAIMPWNFPVW